MQIYVLILIVLFGTHLNALEYGLFAKKEGDAPISRLSLYSERCSGSFYLNGLMYTNTYLEPKHFCHKHFPPWFSLPQYKFQGPPEYYTFENTDDCLFLVIFRDPYDWARSFNKDPWHGHKSMYKLPFSVFIRKPWIINPEDKHMKIFVPWNPLLDRDPETGEVFSNIFKLRTAKHRNFLMIKDRAKNVYYVNYEVVRDHPQEVLAEISSIYNIKLKPEYEPVVYYKGWEPGGIYKPKVYTPISDADLIYINANLDEELENEIGYKLMYPK